MLLRKAPWLALLVITLVGEGGVNSRVAQAALPEFNYPRLANLYLTCVMSDSQAAVLSQYDVNILNRDAPSWSPDAIDTLRAHNAESLVLAFWPTESIYYVQTDTASWPIQEAQRESVLVNGWLAYDADGDTLSSFPQHYTINLSTKCPLGPNGLRYCDWLPGFIEEILVDSTSRARDVDWDGLWLDNIWNSITWLTPDSLDLDANGIGDPPDSANVWWEAGSRAIVDGIRERLGEDTPLVTNGTNMAFAANGRCYENIGEAWSNVDGTLPYAVSWRAWVRDSWWAYLNTFDDYDTTLIPLNIVKSHWNEGSSTHAMPDTISTDDGHAFQSQLRLWLGTTLLSDGFFAFGFTHYEYKSTWWRWEYDMDLGDPGGPMYTLLSCAGDTLYRRDFENGIVVVNPHDDPANCGGDFPTILPWDAYIGPALGSQTVFGTIDSSLTLPSPGFNELYIPGDLKISNGAELTITPCTKVRIASSDSCSIAGGDSALVEIIVEGRLTVEGDEDQGVSFQSAAETPDEGDWWGVRVAESGVATVDHASFSQGVYGVYVADGDTVLMHDCSFAENELGDIVIRESPDSVSVEGCELTVGGGVGIDIALDDGGLSVRECAIHGNASTASGVKCSGSGGAVAIVGCVIDSVSNGNGLWVSAGAPTITESALQYSKYGIYLTGGSPEIGTDDSDSDNLISGNTRGIYSACSGTGSCPTCAGFAPKVRNNTICSNTTGVYVEKRGFIDLGSVALGDGNNSIYGNSSYCVYNKSNCDTVRARGNYWGDCEGGVPVTCWNGKIDATGFTCVEPDAYREPIGLGEMPALHVLGVFPNPATTSARIRFEVGRGESQIEIAIFDVVGQLIRELEGQRWGAGLHEVKWDGKGRDGVLVGPGLYFVRVTANDSMSETVKLLLLHR